MWTEAVGGGEGEEDGNEERKGHRRVVVELFCISRARAEHLRCKILNPGASAISPTFSTGRKIEKTEKERVRKRERVREGGGRGDRREREGGKREQ